MTSREFTILELLDQWGPMTPGELAASWPTPAFAATTHQDMTANLNRLAAVPREFVFRDTGGIWHLRRRARWFLTV